MACRPFLSGGEFLLKGRIAIADDPALPKVKARSSSAISFAVKPDSKDPEIFREARRPLHAEPGDNVGAGKETMRPPVASKRLALLALGAGASSRAGPSKRVLRP
jgi:hypothetical protein